MKPRSHTLSTGLVVHAGRNAKSNDELVRSAQKKDVLLHTKSPGSPFVNVGSDAVQEEIREAAVFCAKYSQEWRDRKRDVVVNVFVRRDMKKGIFMKEGTWKVEHMDSIRVKKADIMDFEKRSKKHETS